MTRIIALLIAFVLAFRPAMAGERADSALCLKPAARIAIQGGTALALNISLTELLKSAVSERRPDGAGDDSFPSRHTSWAFNVATIFSNELYGHSALWPVGFHFAATAVGLQRAVTERHYPSDVLAGAALGIVSTELGYYLADLAMGRHACRRRYAAATPDWRPAVSMTTTALFPLTRAMRHGGRLGSTGVAGRLRIGLPMSESFGVSLNALMTSLSLYRDGVFATSVNGAGATLGIDYYRAIGEMPLSFEASAGAGALKNFRISDSAVSSVSFVTECRAGAFYGLTPTFSIGAEAGYMLMTLGKTVSSLSLSLTTRATF